MTAWLERLNAGRNVWYGTEKVEHLASHHAFKGTVATIEKLLTLSNEALYIEGRHASFHIPKNIEQLQKKQHAYEIWVDETFGMMSRLSEYSREIETGWYANRRQIATYIPHFEEKIIQRYNDSKEHELLSTAAAQDLQRKRSQSAVEVASGQLRIVKKTEEGVIVRGAKTIATAAPYVDEYIISSFHPRSAEQKSLANIFLIPANLAGLQIISRASFASDDKVNQPLSARFDEMDAVLLFEDVLIPWEYVLVHEDPEAAWKLQQDPVAGALSQHQTVVRLVRKLTAVAALANRLASEADITSFLHVQNELATLFSQIEVIKALLQTAQQTGQLINGVYLPNKQYLATARNLGTTYYPKAIEIIQKLSASGLLQAPATLELFDVHPEWHSYFEGASLNGYDRTLLNKVAWDLVGSQLGARHELYERFYSGDPVRTYANYYKQHTKKEAWQQFATSIL